MASAVEHSAAFLRVANTQLCGVGGTQHTFATLRELGLYMMLSSVLSNPSFTYAAGGMQNLLQKHCKNKYFSLHSTWKSLIRKGFLSRTRIPCGTNCFHDYYTLSDAGTISRKSPLHLSVAEGKCFLAQRQPHMPPYTDFTAVPREVLMDARLSLAAKGLYAILARQIRLSVQCTDGHKPEISKKALRSLCAEGKNAFDGLFRELRTTGYLSLIRSHESGRLSYVYQLGAAPCGEGVTVPPKHAIKQPRRRAERPAPRTQGAVTAAVDTAPRITQRDIRAQIEYDILRYDYPQSRLDLIVSIIEGAVVQGQKTPQRVLSLGKDSAVAATLAEKLCALDSEDIRYVLDTVAEAEKTTKIHSMRRYMTTCLYFAKENLALALDCLSFPKTVPKPAYST